MFNKEAVRDCRVDIVVRGEDANWGSKYSHFAGLRGGIGLDKRASPSKLSPFVRYHFDAIEARNIELI